MKANPKTPESNITTSIQAEGREASLDELDAGALDTVHGGMETRPRNGPPLVPSYVAPLHGPREVPGYVVSGEDIHPSPAGRMPIAPGRVVPL